MATIKFYRAKALPSPVTSAHDGVWYIKKPGDSFFRTYVVKGGVLIPEAYEGASDMLGIRRMNSSLVRFGDDVRIIQHPKSYFTATDRLEGVIVITLPIVSTGQRII